MGFEGEMLLQLKSIKIEFSNVNYAAGLVRISMRRKPKSKRKDVQLFGFSKIGNHRKSKI